LDEFWWSARYRRHLTATGVAYGQAHRLAASEKQRHKMAADEPGPAEHSDRADHDSSPCAEIARVMNHGPRSALFKGQENDMLFGALVFFIIAIIPAVFGLGGIAATASSIAQILFFVFLVIFLITLVMGVAGRRRPPI
jgi:uncharacterized membrane protein YtjA (UPF0391 family)